MIKTLKIGIGFEILKRTGQTKRDMGKWLKRNLETSGPTYIKIGQFIGNRPDLFGYEISDELSKLQNQSNNTFQATKPNGIYKMKKLPIAAASIAQVHKGCLHDGRVVAIKIKRPNVENQLKNELEDIKSIFKLSKFFMNDMSLLSDWFDDFEKNISDELDFMKEVRNIQLFHEIYKHNEDFIIPRVLSELSDERHIIMEYVQSKSIKECNNPIRISENLMNTFVEQILYHGIIHGDLHAGNLGVDSDSDKIVMYDFGNVIRIPEFYQKAMRDVLAACQKRDSEELLSAMKSMGMIIRDFKAAKNFANKFFVYLDTLDPSSFEYTQSDIMVPIELDTITLTIIRTYSLVEGLCKEIYPQFTYENIIQQNMELLIIEQFIVQVTKRSHQSRV